MNALLNPDSTDTAITATPSVGAMVAEQTAIAEVQAKIAIAKRFPRDFDACCDAIMKTCQRSSMADQAFFSFKRGTGTVAGLTIHAAKAVAQCWGNMDFGWREVSRNKDNSDVEAWAWDLQTNTRQALTFNVPHWRSARGKSYQLTDERDIYELCANMAARRMRACIESVIPADIWDNASRLLKETQKKSKTPLKDRIVKMTSVFMDEFGVTEERLKKFVGKNIASINETEFIRLQQAYRSIKEGVAEPDEIFPLEQVAGSPKQQTNDGQTDIHPDYAEDWVAFMEMIAEAKGITEINETWSQLPEATRKALSSPFEKFRKQYHDIQMAKANAKGDAK